MQEFARIRRIIVTLKISFTTHHDYTLATRTRRITDQAGAAKSLTKLPIVPSCVESGAAFAAYAFVAGQHALLLPALSYPLFQLSGAALPDLKYPISG